MAETNLSVLQNTQARANGLLKHVYGYMFVGLLLTSVFSFLVSQAAGQSHSFIQIRSSR